LAEFEAARKKWIENVCQRFKVFLRGALDTTTWTYETEAHEIIAFRPEGQNICIEIRRGTSEPDIAPGDTSIPWFLKPITVNPWKVSEQDAAPKVLLRVNELRKHASEGQ